MSMPYPKILQLGDRFTSDIFDGSVDITEKVDGSQIGAGWIDGHWIVRSKGREIVNDALGLRIEDNLFGPALETLDRVRLSLPDGMFLYGETLAKPRHSTLRYDRVPRGNIALFAIRCGNGDWLTHGSLTAFADQLGMDVVPQVFEGTSSPEHTLSLLNRQSFLGGNKVEGVVIKRYMDWEYMGTVLHVKAAKYVSEEFKETHKETWGYTNTAKGSLENLKEGLRTEARWRKAMYHLRDRGEFTGSLRDIGPLIHEVSRDVEEEDQEAIKDALWSVYRKDLLRSATSGLPEWYKQRIALGEIES